MKTIKLSSDGRWLVISWLQNCQAVLNNFYDSSNTPKHLRDELEVEDGNRYIRVWKKGTAQRSAWAFIDKTNLDVLRPATWKAPAKGARGNLTDSSGGMSRIQWTGPMYLR